MSRCFPYPPPGYTLSKASNDALIESIKLQNEREKAKAEKKERKKAKKEKKVNKEKNKGKQEMPRKVDGNTGHEVYGIFQKVGKEEMELLERSGITEELGLPGNSQDPSNSSDSTQNSNKKNSNKRKRNESPVNGVNTGGNILRFRLPSQKQTESKTNSEVEVQQTSGRIDLSNKNDNAGTSRAQLNKLPSASIPTNSTAVQLLPGESSRVQSNKLPSVSMPTTSATVQLLSGESSRVKLNKLPSVSMPTSSASVPSLPGESRRVQSNKLPSIMPPNSTTVQSLPCESIRVQLNKVPSVSMPTNIDKAGTGKVQLNKVPSVSMPPNSTTVQLLPGESSKAPSQSAFQQSVEPQEKHHDDHVSKKSKKQNKAAKKAKKYAKMIDRIPLVPANETVDCDEDWLCCRKNPPEPEVKVQTHNQMSCASSCLLWPRAQYLHEVDLYALPYSIPF